MSNLDDKTIRNLFYYLCFRLHVIEHPLLAPPKPGSAYDAMIESQKRFLNDAGFKHVVHQMVNDIVTVITGDLDIQKEMSNLLEGEEDKRKGGE